MQKKWIAACFVIGLLIGYLENNAHADMKKIRRFESKGQDLEIWRVLDGQGVIWAFDFLPGGELIYTEREGAIKILNLKNGSTRPISNPPEVLHAGQGGMLDVVAHYNFKKNRFLYLTYSTQTEQGKTTTLMRARLKGDRLENKKILFEAKPRYGTTHHYGSRIVFDRKGHLFLTIGDRGKRDRAQSLRTHNGKIIRLREDGSTPKDNPFVGRSDALPEIWSYGHRNPQGLAFDRTTGKLFNQEHGPKGGDEINRITKGKNYGWPIITYGVEYSGLPIGDGITHKKGMEQPLHYWRPSIAPSGLWVYSGKKIKAWKGDLFSGALSFQHLNRLRLKNGKKVEEERLFKFLNARVRSVRESPEGELYFGTDGGKLFKVVPAAN